MAMELGIGVNTAVFSLFNTVPAGSRTRRVAARWLLQRRSIRRAVRLVGLLRPSRTFGWIYAPPPLCWRLAQGR
jgi:hypothetical protein